MSRPSRIGILVVAYNAVSTLHQVLDRIPEDFRGRLEHVLVSDDASTDATYLVGLGYQAQDPDFPITVLRQPRNLGYGGNQKVGYEWAIANDLDIVVLLHGDGQYAPEMLPDMVAPLERGECDAVFGSRMMNRGSARRGGMPAYKYVGNRVLSAFENRVMGSSLSEWHSGYRAYRVDALREIPFERNSDDFDFDTQIIVQLLEAGKAIHEIPIPTFYGDEISRVNGMHYAFDISRYVVRYRLQKMGFGRGDLVFATHDYEDTAGTGSSDAVIVSVVGPRSARRVLDLGCGDGAVDRRLRAVGHEVTGVDEHEPPAVDLALDRFVAADLRAGVPVEVGTGYDVVIGSNLFEHVAEPERVLDEIHGCLAPNGALVARVPNVAHWYPRLRFGSGRFDYDTRGILDRRHLRFFTRRSFERLATDAGYRVVHAHPIGLPIGVVERGAVDADGNKAPRALELLDRAALALAPNLFAYEWVFELQAI